MSTVAIKHRCGATVRYIGVADGFDEGIRVVCVDDATNEKHVCPIALREPRVKFEVLPMMPMERERVVMANVEALVQQMGMVAFNLERAVSLVASRRSEPRRPEPPAPVVVAPAAVAVAERPRRQMQGQQANGGVLPD